MDRLQSQHSQNSELNKIFDHNDFEEGAEEIQKPLMGAASAAKPLLAKIANTNFDLKPQEVMNRLQAQHNQNSESFNKQSDAFNKITDHNHVGDSKIEEAQEATSAAKQFSQFNKNNEDKLGEPIIHSLHHHHPLHHIPIKHIPHHHNIHHNIHHNSPHHHIPHHHIPHNLFDHHRSSEPDDQFATDDSQLFKNRENELNSRFNPQQYGESLYSPINSRFSSQQYDSPVGQTFNEFNNRLVPHQYNNIDQLNSRFNSEQMNGVVGQSYDRNNQFNSGFASQQYNNPVGQTFYNRESESNHLLPFQQFENPHGQPMNRNSKSNSRFVPQMFDRNANVPSEVGSSHSNADAIKLSSSDDNSLFFHDKDKHNKIETPTSRSQFLVGSKDPQHYESLNSDINIDNKHLDNHQKTNEDKTNVVVSMPNVDSGKNNLGISSDTFNSIENDSQSKQNPFSARASELMKKLKDRQDQTMQRLENQKQQLEKAKENILGMVKPVDGVKTFDKGNIILLTFNFY